MLRMAKDADLHTLFTGDERLRCLSRTTPRLCAEFTGITRIPFTETLGMGSEATNREVKWTTSV